MLTAGGLIPPFREARKREIMERENRDYVGLVIAIIEQACEDYRECVANHKSTREIERFFRSKWCAELLHMLDVTKVTGWDILRYLEMG